MNRRLFVPLIVAGMAAVSGVASANADYWRDNGLMLEVSADPRDGTDHVRVDPTHATQLELFALNDTVTLRGITLHFSDGRAMTRPLSFVRPGQPVLVDLPRNCEPITSVDLDYGDPALRRYDRTSARLQIVPHRTRSFEQTQVGYYEPAYNQPVYTQPVYTRPIYTPPAPAYYRPRPVRQSRYTVARPRRTQAAWTIEGSFRF